MFGTADMLRFVCKVIMFHLYRDNSKFACVGFTCSVPELCKVVEAKWNDHHAATAGEPPSPTCISSEFGGAQQAIEIALTKCCEFMGTKIVFWDMRKMWLEELHRHKVQKGGLDAILGKLNKYLTSLSEGALADVLGTVAGKPFDHISQNSAILTFSELYLRLLYVFQMLSLSCM